MFSKILIPLDGSRYGGRAIPYAVAIAKKFNAEVILLQAVHPTPPIMPASAGGAMMDPTTADIILQSAEKQNRSNLSKANRYLKARLKEITAQGVKATFHSELGDPAGAIIKFCKKESVDLVVMTTSGKGGLKRAFLGSVADKVIRAPGIHVLAIRPEAKKKKK